MTQSHLFTDTAAIEVELQRRLTAYREGSFNRSRPLPPVKCSDGFRVSMQVGDYIYCSPRSNSGPWSAVELSFPSAPMLDLAEYCGSEDKSATKTVWGYVPIGEVAAVLASHGGLLPVESAS